MEIEIFDGVTQELKEDFDAIAMGKSAYVLDTLTVKVHEHPTQQWLQCVLELRVRYNKIRRHLINREKMLREIEALEDDLDKELKRIDLDDLEWSLLGAKREFVALYSVYKSMPRFTAGQIEQGQAEYWYNRLTKQATQDILAQGRVSPSNQEGLRQIGVTLKVENPPRIEADRVNGE